MARPSVTPVLETGRLSLLPFSEKDHLTAHYVSWLNDPEVVRFSEQRHMHHDMESCRDYVRDFVASGYHIWAIVSREASLGHIGNITATIDPPNQLADVAILIGERKAWGAGLGSEAWNCVCAWLLRSAGMRKVAAGALAANKAMVSIMEKAGMQPDGRRRAHYLVDGQPVDMIYTALFSEARVIPE